MTIAVSGNIEQDCENNMYNNSYTKSNKKSSRAVKGLLEAINKSQKTLIPN